MHIAGTSLTVLLDRTVPADPGERGTDRMDCILRRRMLLQRIIWHIRFAGNKREVARGNHGIVRLMSSECMQFSSNCDVDVTYLRKIL